MFENIPILKFDVYPEAVEWLDCVAGVAIRGENDFMGSASTHVLFSGLLDINVITLLVSRIEGSEVIPQKGSVEHRCFLVRSTRNAIIDSLKALGMVKIEKAKHCIEPVSTEECIDRLVEMRIRAGIPFSMLSLEEQSRLYRLVSE